MALSKEQRRLRIKRRIRKRVLGSAEKPRLSVFRSNKEIYAQIIDDETGKTLVTASSLKNSELRGIPKKEQAKQVGLQVGKLAVDAGINEVIFDRNGYLYHGRVKSLADAARESGLKF